MMSGSKGGDSVGAERLADHPSDGELYNFFASRRTELDVKRREQIAIHVVLCEECAITGELIEQTEELLAAQLSISPSEEDRANVDRSLAMVRTVIFANDQLRAPINPPEQKKEWIPIRVKDFFFLRWSTVTGRLQLVASSLLAVVVLSLLGLSGYRISVLTISRLRRPTEQLPDRRNSSPVLAQASPQPTPVPSSSPPPLVQKNKTKHLSTKSNGDQLLAHLNNVVSLNHSREDLYRGGGTRPKYYPTIHALTDGPTRIHIRLPDGSVSGSYTVTIEDPYFEALRPPAKGESPDGKELIVSLELGGLAAPSYYLGIAREGSAPVHHQVRLQFIKK